MIYFKVHPFQVFPAPKGVSDLQYFCQIVPAEGKALMYRPLASLQTLLRYKSLLESHSGQTNQINPSEINRKIMKFYVILILILIITTTIIIIATFIIRNMLMTKMVNNDRLAWSQLATASSAP